MGESSNYIIGLIVVPLLAFVLYAAYKTAPSKNLPYQAIETIKKTEQGFTAGYSFIEIAGFLFLVLMIGCSGVLLLLWAHKQLGPGQ